MTYVELHARSGFSFLEGACVPEELAGACAHYEMPAMAIVDRFSADVKSISSIDANHFKATASTFPLPPRRPNPMSYANHQPTETPSSKTPRLRASAVNK